MTTATPNTLSSSSPCRSSSSSSSSSSMSAGDAAEAKAKADTSSTESIMDGGEKGGKRKHAGLQQATTEANTATTGKEEDDSKGSASNDENKQQQQSSSNKKHPMVGDDEDGRRHHDNASKTTSASAISGACPNHMNHKNPNLTPMQSLFEPPPHLKPLLQEQPKPQPLDDDTDHVRNTTPATTTTTSAATASSRHSQHPAPAVSHTTTNAASSSSSSHQTWMGIDASPPPPPPPAHGAGMVVVHAGVVERLEERVFELETKLRVLARLLQQQQSIPPPPPPGSSSSFLNHHHEEDEDPQSSPGLFLHLSPNSIEKGRYSSHNSSSSHRRKTFFHQQQEPSSAGAVAGATAHPASPTIETEQATLPTDPGDHHHQTTPPPPPPPPASAAESADEADNDENEESPLAFCRRSRPGGEDAFSQISPVPLSPLPPQRQPSPLSHHHGSRLLPPDMSSSNESSPPTPQHTKKQPILGFEQQEEEGDSKSTAADSAAAASSSHSRRCHNDDKTTATTRAWKMENSASVPHLESPVPSGPYSRKRIAFVVDPEEKEEKQQQREADNMTHASESSNVTKNAIAAPALDQTDRVADGGKSESPSKSVSSKEQDSAAGGGQNSNMDNTNSSSKEQDEETIGPLMTDRNRRSSIEAAAMSSSSSHHHQHQYASNTALTSAADHHHQQQQQPRVQNRLRSRRNLSFQLLYRSDSNGNVGPSPMSSLTRSGQEWFLGQLQKIRADQLLREQQEEAERMAAPEVKNKWLDYLNSFQESTPDVDAQMEEFILVPGQLEKLLFVGHVICVDSFLYMVTVLPIRFLWSCILLLQYLFVLVRKHYRRRQRRRQQQQQQGQQQPFDDDDEDEDDDDGKPLIRHPQLRFHRRHFYQLIQVSILYVIYTYLLAPISFGQLYHWIRAQAMIKLYVLIAMVEMFDRLFGSLGQDCLDSMYWNTVSQPRSSRFVISCLVVLTYSAIHAIILLLHVATLNVAMNSNDQALLTLMISGNFAEVKSAVFKKYNKASLFKITASDICERFKLGLFLGLVLLLNLSQGMDRKQFLDYMRVCGLVWAAELLSDWIKHAFIIKFNFLPSTVYPEYALLLAGDVTGFGHEGVNLDHSHACVKRIGFAQIPLVCIMFRLVREAIKYASMELPETGRWSVNSNIWYAVGLCFWLLLLGFKVALGHVLQTTSMKRLKAAPEYSQQPKRALMKKKDKSS